MEAFGGRVALLVGGIGTVVAGAIGFLWYAALPAEAKRSPVVVPESGAISVIDESESASPTDV